MKKIAINSNGKIETKPSKKELIAMAIARAEERARIIQLAKEAMERGEYYA